MAVGRADDLYDAEKFVEDAGRKPFRLAAWDPVAA
jgi:hypothetical protein